MAALKRVFSVIGKEISMRIQLIKKRRKMSKSANTECKVSIMDKVQTLTINRATNTAVQTYWQGCKCQITCFHQTNSRAFQKTQILSKESIHIGLQEGRVGQPESLRRPTCSITRQTLWEASIHTPRQIALTVTRRRTITDKTRVGRTDRVLDEWQAFSTCNGGTRLTWSRAMLIKPQQAICPHAIDHPLTNGTSSSPFLHPSYWQCPKQFGLSLAMTSFRQSSRCLPLTSSLLPYTLSFSRSRPSIRTKSSMPLGMFQKWVILRAFESFLTALKLRMKYSFSMQNCFGFSSLEALVNSWPSSWFYYPTGALLRLI